MQKTAEDEAATALADVRGLLRVMRATLSAAWEHLDAEALLDLVGPVLERAAGMERGSEDRARAARFFREAADAIDGGKDAPDMEEIPDVDAAQSPVYECEETPESTVRKSTPLEESAQSRALQVLLDFASQEEEEEELNVVHQDVPSLAAAPSRFIPPDLQGVPEEEFHELDFDFDLADILSQEEFGKEAKESPPIAPPALVFRLPPSSESEEAQQTDREEDPDDDVPDVLSEDAEETPPSTVPPPPSLKVSFQDCPEPIVDLEVFLGLDLEIEEEDDDGAKARKVRRKRRLHPRGKKRRRLIRSTSSSSSPQEEWEGGGVEGEAKKPKLVGEEAEAALEELDERKCAATDVAGGGGDAGDAPTQSKSVDSESKSKMSDNYNGGRGFYRGLRNTLRARKSRNKRNRFQVKGSDENESKIAAFLEKALGK